MKPAKLTAKAATTKTPIARNEICVTEDKSEDFMKMHTVVIGWHIYSQQLGQGIADNAQETAFSHLSDTLLRMKTRDPLEEMLVVQSLWTHARLARLSSIANNQTNANHIKVVNDACDRAANTYRRQMLALAEYRRPARTDQFLAIKQANVAQQQVVQNAETPILQNRKQSNGKGLPAIDAAALPAITARSIVASPIHSAIQAVVKNPRPTNPSGEENYLHERAQARRTCSESHRGKT